MLNLPDEPGLYLCAYEKDAIEYDCLLHITGESPTLSVAVYWMSNKRCTELQHCHDGKLAFDLVIGPKIDLMIHPNPKQKYPPIKMSKPAKISFDSSPFLTALDSARELLESRPELVDVFFTLFDPLTKLARFESQPAVGTSLTVFLKPSDLLIDFLAASGTVDGKVHIVE